MFFVTTADRRTQFRNTFNTGNLDEIARYYTDDMVKFGQNSPQRFSGEPVQRPAYPVIKPVID